MSLDLAAADLLVDPYPRLAELRAQGPMLRESEQRWVATSHSAVSAVLRDRRFGRLWNDWKPVDQMEPFNALHRNQLMENEPPEHTRMRKLLAGAFARGHIERMRPRIADLAGRLLDDLPTDRPVDLLARYAEPMPVYVIADLLGVPRTDHEQLRGWSQAIVRMYEQDVDATVRAAAVTASEEFSGYVRDVIEERRRRPGPDLISDLLAERADPQVRDGAGDRQRLSDDELVATVVLLLNAGHEASVNVFGNGVYALLSNPVELARVLGGEVGIGQALEEMIRFDAPLQLFERTAQEPVEVAGQRIAAGERVVCLMGSANRDEQAFDAAERFDVGRSPNPHVGFGMGLHFCLGAPLARLELEITVRQLLERFGQITLTGRAPRRPTWVLRGFESIEVDLGQRS